MVARCIDALLTNELQHKFNRVGSKGGEAFAKWLEPLVKQVAKSAFSTSTEKDIEMNISNYLRNSRDRLGGRRRRSKPIQGPSPDIPQLSAYDSD